MASHDSHEDPHVGHIVPIRTYTATLIALIVLMLLTVIASDYHLGATVINNLAAMAIACTKALLVIFIFMGVKFSSNLAKFWALVGFTWVTLMTFILVDYGTRKYDPTISKTWNADPGSALFKEKPGVVGPSTAESIGKDGVNLHVR